MKHRVTSWALVCAVLAACGPDDIVPAELGEVCGAASPVRVLELAPDQQIYSDTPLQVANRVVYVLSEHGVDEADARFPTIAGTSVWSTGPCGEAPVELATGVDFVVASGRWPDLVLGCRMETGDVVALDPSGEREPAVIFADVGADPNYGCGFASTPHGVLTIDAQADERGALVFHRYPDDPYGGPAEPTVLLADVRVPAMPSLRGPGILGGALHAFDEFVLALTAEDELVRVALADGAVTTLRSGVREFSASRDGRYVLWQSSATTGLLYDYPAGKIFLRDLAAGTDVPLLESSLAFNQGAMLSAQHGVFAIRLGLSTEDPQRVFRLPTLEFTDLPPGLFLGASLGDARWLGQYLFERTWVIVDLGTGMITQFFSGGGFTIAREPDAVTLFSVDGSNPRTEGRVWRVPLDGSKPTRQARRATRYLERLEDGRLVTPLSVNRQWLGSLVLVDPTTQDELLIDERVFAFSLDPAPTDDDVGVLRYSVSDGERSGVYLARLPAP